MATYIIRLNPAILCFSEVRFTAVTNTNFDEECFYHYTNIKLSWLVTDREQF